MFHCTVIRMSAITLAAAISTASADDTDAHKAQVTPLIASSETVLGRAIAYPEGQAKITAAIITIPPGGETGWHTHAVPIFGYMLDGELTVDYGDRGTRVYKEGDSLLDAMNWPHNGMNMSEVPLRILAVYAGSEGIPNAEPTEPP